MKKPFNFSREQQSLQEIASHREVVERALRRFYDVKRSDFADDFGGARMDNVKTDLAERLKELDRVSSLQLLAAVEAALRIDYIQRCELFKKDKVSKAFRWTYRWKTYRAGLVDDILQTWRIQIPEVSAAVSELKGAFKYRDWLAHGRYWAPNLGRNYEFNSIYRLVEPLLDELALLDSSS
jgi:hypothetical protein